MRFFILVVSAALLVSGLVTARSINKRVLLQSPNCNNCHLFGNCIMMNCFNGMIPNLDISKRVLGQPVNNCYTCKFFGTCASLNCHTGTGLIPSDLCQYWQTVGVKQIQGWCRHQTIGTPSKYLTPH